MKLEQRIKLIIQSFKNTGIRKSMSGTIYVTCPRGIARIADHNQTKYNKMKLRPVNIDLRVYDQSMERKLLMWLRGELL